MTEAFRRAAEDAASRVPGTALVTLAGSHAYGTDRPGSDLDIMGVYVAPTREILSLRPPAATYKFPDRDVTFYELHHFCKLAANANPTVLELLAAPLLVMNAHGAQIRLHADAFLSKVARKTYGGYAISQIRKAEAGTGGSRGAEHHKREKFLVHTLRLLVQGRHLLETGLLRVRLTGAEIEDLRTTAQGGLNAVRDRVPRMLDDLDAAVAASPLPDRPDHERITDLICLLRGVA